MFLPTFQTTRQPQLWFPLHLSLIQPRPRPLLSLRQREVQPLYAYMLTDGQELPLKEPGYG